MEEENPSKRFWFIGMGVLVTVLALAAGAWLGRPAYHRFKERRSLGQARAFMEKGDPRGAVLALRQTLAVNPANVEATRLMAQLAAEAQSPAALSFWQRVVELSPTVENNVMLAAIALRVEAPPFPICAHVIEELRAPGETNVGYQLAASQLAIKLNRISEAAAHLEVAARLEPTNRLHQLNLATLRLQSADAAVAEAARADLVALVPEPGLGENALRSLVADALARHRQLSVALSPQRPPSPRVPGQPGEGGLGGEGQLQRALDFSRQLLARPQANFADQLQQLTVLQEAKSDELPGFLQRAWQHAVNFRPLPPPPPSPNRLGERGGLEGGEGRIQSNAVRVSQTVIWMTGHERAKEARDWLAQLPPELRGTMPLPLAEADGLVALGDWPALESFLQGQRWKDIDFMRQAYWSLAAEKRGGDASVVDGHWRSAVHEAGERLGALSTLLALAHKWNRAEAREDLLWRIANRFPAQKWAARELGRGYIAAGNTRGLNKLYGAMLNADPGSVVHKNNFAATSLLLKANLTQAHQFAREIFAAAPKDPIPVSTYAWSLHLQGKTKAGLAALQKLDPPELEKLPVALYQGLLLWAAGQTNEAQHYLDIAAKATDLLPEEKALLAECKRSAEPQ